MIMRFRHFSYDTIVGEEPMDYTIIIATATALAGLWLRVHLQRIRLREESRRDHIRHLPPGSRVLDLGSRGVVIDVGRPPNE
ncbi:hypothetical protein [Herbidospora cretacea]|uniref:hypothetical protein n=1 Tax=Herbidospora cretacea TaxID=28444 RepID=UPI0007743B01|nr:hypothetical protein [Herbidospora cretacea]